jgi:hypothetical protein
MPAVSHSRKKQPKLTKQGRAAAAAKELANGDSAVLGPLEEELDRWLYGIHTPCNVSLGY